MTRTSIIAPIVLVTALVAGATPALAQSRGQNRARPQASTRSTAVQRQDHGARSVAPSRDSRPVAVQRDRRAEVRSYDTRRYVAPRNVWVEPYRPRFIPRGGAAFGLGLNIGGVRFGLFAGRPFAYRFGYGMRAYRYPIRIVPGISYGGVSFLVTPGDAAVYVDGTYVGLASDFYGNVQPLPLTPGVHRIELQAEGYSPMVFDVDVMPGQVIPYEGTLRPLF
jgi:hypothetical protein